MDKITVTSPLLPNLDEFNEMLKDVWASKWITNGGQFHQRLESALAEYLKVPYICLFTNGTLPLLTALQALRISGEVITTPYSFVATTHSIWWNGCRPVFVDIEESTCGIDPNKIEAAITPKTTAIMPVHCYGKPVNMEAIQAIADKYGLRVIYDAAHAFGVAINGKSVLNAGDMATLSFHATKVYNTLEGGALVVHDEATKNRIDYLKNFGFANETDVVAPGINSKMDEVRAAYGLLNLKQVDEAIEKRHQVAIKYRAALRNVPGVRFFDDMPGVRHNYSYFPIFINAEVYGMTRDELYFKMKANGVLGRRYFFPLISTFSTYRGLPSAAPSNLPVATRIANEVICLPMHHELCERDVERILELIVN
ncbi:MAG: DegT/DnrJ/EryC1/StrS family aminotransferase [Bacteroidales bacterium]|nr:DegT/DnrJ/EryC1/StrS family aminotransferase [Bacteroidales bacterium]